MGHDPLDIIARKRDGQELDADDLRAFATGAAAGTIPDYQIAAWLMAGYLNGFTDAETAALTVAMLETGVTADLSAIRGPKVGKHSTGGVGDKVSLIAAPVCAALGVAVPKLSGRGLGHTGGTLDKLEAIPGFRTGLELDEYARITAAVGCCIAGQSAAIAPADKVLYALRDVTGTVASIPLIAASIMSKKLAEGIDALVLDVKCGQGAFMRSRDDAARLARAMEAVGAAMGKRVAACITPMDAPLGTHVGNALEVEEAVLLLRGAFAGRGDLLAVCETVAGRMLLLGGAVATAGDQAEAAAAAMVRRALEDGSALEKFRQWVAAQGGDPRVADDPCGVLPQAACAHEVRAARGGVVAGIDALAVGQACRMLGAGRLRKGDAIDPACGVVLRRKPGDAVERGEVVLEVRARTSCAAAAALLEGAVALG
ncbi:MAG: thymidine phosphorylase [Desulfovibrionaceae bacterium]